MTLLGLLTKIKYSITKHKMYPDGGGENWHGRGMRNKLFSLHGLSVAFILLNSRSHSKITNNRSVFNALY